VDFLTFIRFDLVNRSEAMSPFAPAKTLFVTAGGSL
jgi:hypothetical protein